jgi:hypothetical protein
MTLIDLDSLAATVLTAPKPKHPEEDSLEFLYSCPSEDYYKLFQNDYLLLPQSIDSSKKSVYILSAPSGSGKTKFIFDLALYKGFRVIYMDWTMMQLVIQYLTRIYGNAFESHQLRANLVENEVRDSINKFNRCVDQTTIMLFEIMYWIISIADQLSELPPEDFLKFWVERMPHVQVKVLELLDSGIKAPSHVGDYVFAFDECQLLLRELCAGEIYTIDASGEKHQGSLYTIFSRVCDTISNSSQVVIGGTSIKLTLMAKHSSLMRRGLCYSIKPPFFSEDVVEAFLIKNGIPKDLSLESKRFLVGRPLTSTFFVRSWRNIMDDQFKSYPSAPIALRTILVNMTIERMVLLFKSKDNGDASIFMSRVGSEKSLSLRKVLSDLCANGYINTLALQDPTIIEEICTLFLPLSRDESNDRWEYRQDDPIAFQALLRCMLDAGEDLHWARMSADRLYDMILEQRAITGEVGEFIMEAFLMSISNSGLLISDIPLFGALKGTDFGQCHFQLKSVYRDDESFFSVLDNCDFGALCMSVDKMARFDFFCLARHPKDEFVVAVFGGCKLYSRNVAKDVFCDNILSTDPCSAYTNAGGVVLNSTKKAKFDLAWQKFNKKYAVKVLQVVFTYPQPVGSVEYPDDGTFQFSNNQLCLFLGHEEIEQLSCNDVKVGTLVQAATGWKTQNRKGPAKRLREALQEFRERKKLKKAESKE